MNLLTLMLLCVVPYGEAYNRADKNIRPLVIQVGAEWCPPCHALRARLDALYPAYTYVDVDKDPVRARKLMRGNSIPQLIRWEKVNGKWVEQRYNGRSDADLQKFLR